MTEAEYQAAMEDAAWEAHCWICDHMSEINAGTLSPGRISEGIANAIRACKPKQETVTPP